ncbi:MAG: BREX system P-loop protein BrxC [Candidatus Tritonobacter lacicola]|nr:BREX system P-loop protein BrxC [Candidatus Tritonobacter lacicola]
MSNLKQFFSKPVDRPIEGVIKADDDSHILLEVEEYVLTNEISRQLDVFLDAYNNYEGANGVWISGFFGSGKSHLLKILSFLLEDRVIDGTRLCDVFLPKINDEFLRGDLEKAIKIPSRSILFNIDQKADVISKSQVDAVLSVFVKVFNEMQGYYPQIGYIASFERDLDSQGKYEAFKKAYEDAAGVSWEKDRKRVHKLKNEQFAKAYSAFSGISYDEALKVLDKYQANYAVSIEDFALMVKEYIDRQEPGFRLNFFVDEVGQYVADNTKLMTNLQTIAESLASKCRGQAWILVTSQEDMSTVIGDLSQRQGNDFSKIKARFKTPMKLTGADVEEVIQKRLLEKNSEGIDYLTDVFHREHNNFKTLFQFGDGTRTYKLFRDKENFVTCYPFIPYQFTLFQLAIKGLSSHNAFEGKHTSVGERSMLGVFQDVVINVSQSPLGQLATFELMFEGIRMALKADIQTSINIGERQLPDDFTKRVLKALFLVKFIKEFKATARNIAILMIDSFEIDLEAHAKQVQEALNRLELETYIQRNGEIYEFLTDDEKDVEQEIKHTDIDNSAINELLVDLIYRHIIRDPKIRYEENKQDYPFARKLDGALAGRDAELAINVITPFNENNSNEQVLVSQSLGVSELLVILPEDKRLEADLNIYKKTEKYVSQNISTTLKDSVRKILAEKTHQNQQRKADLQARLISLLGGSRLFINGSRIEIPPGDAKSRIIKAFQLLVKSTYPNLKMLKVIYKEENIRSILLDKSDDLFKHNDESLSEAELEMLGVINRNRKAGERSTVKRLLDAFEIKPYGWYQAAILCILSKLYLRGKVEVKQDSNILGDSDVFAAFTNNRAFANTIIEPQESFSAIAVRKLKDFHQEFFNEANPGNEAKEVAQASMAKVKEEAQSIDALADQRKQYPFLDALDEPLAEIWKISNKNYPFYLNELDSFAERLLDLKEQIIDPIKKFMHGPKRKIYDNIKEFSSMNNANFSYVDGEEATVLREMLTSGEPYKGNAIQQAKQALDTLSGRIDALRVNEKKAATAAIDARIKSMDQLYDFNKLDAGQKEKVLAPFETVKGEISHASLIPVIRETLNRFETEVYLQQLKLMTQLANPKTDDDEVKDPVSEYIAATKIRIDYPKACLETREDVEDYIGRLKEEYERTIQEGKRISL